MGIEKIEDAFLNTAIFLHVCSLNGNVVKRKDWISVKSTINSFSLSISTWKQSFFIICQRQRTLFNCFLSFASMNLGFLFKFSLNICPRKFKKSFDKFSNDSSDAYFFYRIDRMMLEWRQFDRLISFSIQRILLKLRINNKNDLVIVPEKWYDIQIIGINWKV